MEQIAVFPETVFSVGPVNVTDTVVTTWIVMAAIAVVCRLATRDLRIKPTRFQEVVEGLVEAMLKNVREVLPVEPWGVVPVLGTIWILIGFSNLAGLLPGLKTPTADLNSTFAMAVISYSMTHVFGIRSVGLREYLAHYREPMLLLLPFHLMAEVTRTMALAIRLFGNMMSGEMVAVILLGLAGLLVPVPFSLLHVAISIIQAYIFGILTLVFIAGGLRERHGGETPLKGGT